MSATNASGDGAGRAGRSILAFFLLAFALAIPFWLIGALTERELLPGLPMSSLATVCPAAAAAILVYRRDKGKGVIALLKRSLDFRRARAKAWYLPTLLLMPAVMALSFAVLRLGGVPVPAPQIAALPTVILCAVFFVAALGEELGWSSYAIDAMEERWGALLASLMMGSIWAIYHYVGLAQADRAIGWIAWWSLGAVALRVILVWLYDNTGRSVFVAALFHMTINVTWQLFPVNGSYYDPGVTAIIVTVVAAIVSAAWGPRALARFGLRAPNTLSRRRLPG